MELMLLQNSLKERDNIESSEADYEASLRGQAEIWRHIFAFVDSLALKCAIDLQIPYIIHSHGRSITLSQIISRIESPCTDNSSLERIMRLLVRRNIFSIDHPSDGGGEPLYGLTYSSRWLVNGSDSNLSALYLIETHPYLVGSWHFLSQSVKEGGRAFRKAFGRGIWDMASEDHRFNKMFNDGMACDMFYSIPNADALLLKWILHDWDDEACVKILINCRKAIPEKTGKVIIIDVVLQPDGNELFDDTGLAFDLQMMVNNPGGKERTELQWKKLLEEGGFPRYKIIKIPALLSIIEAYPE
ncbi:hypothetical protein ACOSQ3_002443 [Xanthoceras sorbifolium]